VARHDIVVIGASAGGVDALQRLARDLPRDFPAAVFVVLHMPPYLKSVLPDMLDREGPLRVSEAGAGEPIEEGRIYIARPAFHLILDRGRVQVSQGPKENGYRPSIDVLFRSAARAYGPRVIAVTLSGLLDDGAAGAIAVKQRGGLVVVQALEDAPFPDMPRATLQAVGTADYSVPISELAMLLAMLARTSAPVEEAFPTPLEMQVEDDIAHGAESDAQVSSLLGEASAFSCPECGGVLWDLSGEGVQRFRCQVGHAYSAVHLFHAQEATLQQRLWAAVRALREHALLARQIQQTSTRSEWPSLAERFLETSVQSDENASLLTAMVETIGKPENEGAESRAEAGTARTRRTRATDQRT
jgi:two-component system, chemotaxis family, protein-glutamate methylesterase/glutaminase